MTEEAIRHRLAMAAFYEPDQLWDAVVELLASGLGIDQQCCAGRADTLTEITPPRRLSWELSARLWGLVRCVEPYVASDNPKDIFATSGQVLKTLTHACPARSSLDLATSTPFGTAGSRNGSCKQLRQHIDAGAVLLVISAETPGQQVASSHVLLRNSRHGVQTFEFTEAARH
jgi:hypothetical protein